MIRTFLFSKSIFVLSALILAVPALAEIGITNTEIKIGTSTPLTGPSSSRPKKALDGQELYFKKINAHGGVHGRKIKLVALDDAYEPTRAAVNTKKLIEDDQVFALLGFFGTPTIKAALPLIEQYHVPVIAPTSGAMFLRQPANPDIYNVKASYFGEVEKLVDFLVKRGSKRIAVFYQDDAFGQEGKNGAQKALAKHGMKLVAAGPFTRNTDKIDPAFSLIAKAKPDGVIIYGLGRPCIDFAVRAEKEKLGATLAMGSSLLTDEIVKGTESMKEPIYGASSMPLPEEDHRALTRDYVKESKAAGLLPDPSGFEGYIGAAVLVEALEKAGPKLTRDSLRDAFEHKMNGISVGGFKLDFSPTNHQAISDVGLVIMKNGTMKTLTHE